MGKSPAFYARALCVWSGALHGHPLSMARNNTWAQCWKYHLNKAWVLTPKLKVIISGSPRRGKKGCRIQLTIPNCNFKSQIVLTRPLRGGRIFGTFVSLGACLYVLAQNTKEVFHGELLGKKLQSWHYNGLHSAFWSPLQDLNDKEEKKKTHKILELFKKELCELKK